jgi:hypothetical protein
MWTRILGAVTVLAQCIGERICGRRSMSSVSLLASPPWLRSEHHRGPDERSLGLEEPEAGAALRPYLEAEGIMLTIGDPRVAVEQPMLAERMRKAANRRE